MHIHDVAMMNRIVGVAVLLGVALAASPARAQPLTFSRSDIASYPGARGAVAADFNRDGWIDMATANTGRDSVTILLNQKDERFAIGRDTVVGGGPFDLAAGDVDGDGIPDLVVANADRSTIDVLRTGANASLKSLAQLSAASNPRGVALADVNRDGFLDIIYTAFYQNGVVVLNGDGTGAFMEKVALPTAAGRPQGIAHGDFNNDGRLDLAIANTTSTSLTMMYGDGTGRFTRKDVAGPHTLNVLAAHDYDADGWLDLAAASSSSHAVVFFRGSAAGLKHAVTVPSAGSPRGLAFADVNTDGWQDVVVANRDASTIGVLLNGRTAGWTVWDELPAASGTRAVVAADFDGDGLTDIAAGAEFASTATVYFNDTALPRASFALRAEPLVAAGVDNYDTDAVAADFNHNGTIDVLFGTQLVLDGRTVRQVPLSYSNRAVTADFNRDGHADIVAYDSHYTNNTSFYGLSVLAGDGTGGFTVAATYGGLYVHRMEAADLNRDGKVDVAITAWDYTTHNLVLWTALNQGNATFALLRLDLFEQQSGWQLADMDRDGRIDFVASLYSGVFRIRRGDGTGRFGAAQDIATGGKGIHSMTVGDLSRDGRLDLIFAAENSLRVMLATPSGWEPVVEYAESRRRGHWGGEGDLHVFDFDRDGAPDVVTGLGHLYRGNGDGTLQPVEEFEVYSPGAVFADWNRDGLADMITTEYQPRVILNTRIQENTAPVASLGGSRTSFTWRYDWQFEDEAREVSAGSSTDADLHALEYEWLDGDGRTIGYGMYISVPAQLPGTYRYEVIVRDLRGGESRLPFTITIESNPEIILWAAYDSWYMGTWTERDDATAAGGAVRIDPNLGAPKSAAPLAETENFVQFWFAPDPTLEYKLWIRLKAQNNSWANDSVWVQFSDAVDSTGNPIFRQGTTQGMAVNLEECSGCGISGWGWEDDGWGSVNRNGMLLRFPRIGTQTITIQTREDGVMIDQIVLSAQKYKTTRPGAAKNDTTIIPKY